jgi:hypothetical protein
VIVAPGFGPVGFVSVAATALLRRERVRQDRLRHGLEAAAARPLQDAKHDHGGESRSGPAQEGTRRENAETDHEEPLAAEQADKPPADGQDDGIRYEVRREHPSALVASGAEAARHIRQRHVGDARVEHLHERRQRDHDRDQPRVGLRAPRAICLSL